MNDLAKLENVPAAIEAVLIKGDLRSLDEKSRVTYYSKVCEVVGLNPLTKPFEYIELQGKLTLYATKACCEQLRRLYRISIQIVDRRKDADLFTVVARARTPDGREDESMAALDITGMKGERLANAIMKTETKAKRRVTLSICGLGMLDESEVESIERELEAPREGLARIIQDAKEAPKILPAARPEPVKSGPHRYKILELTGKQQQWLEAQGAEWDDVDLVWVSKKRIERLDKYEVKDAEKVAYETTSGESVEESRESGNFAGNRA